MRALILEVYQFFRHHYLINGSYLPLLTHKDMSTIVNICLFLGGNGLGPKTKMVKQEKDNFWILSCCHADILILV